MCQLLLIVSTKLLSGEHDKAGSVLERAVSM